MAKSKPTPRNSRKKQSSKRPFLYLLLTLILIGGVLYLLDHRKQKVTEKIPSDKPPVAVTEKPLLPPVEPLPRPEAEKPVSPEKPVGKKPVHKQYSSPALTVPVVPPPVKISGPAVVAIIIDDMGSSMSEVRALMKIGVPLTFSVIPGLHQSREVATAAHNNGYEVMLHIPMEPRDYPRKRLESNGLLLSYGDQEVETRMRGFMNQIPYAVGANNHMGSRFTEDRGKMGVVLNVLKENRMFFIDSMTSPKSVGLAMSRELGLRSTARNAPFLDNSQDVSAIKTQLASLTKMAVKRGSAVGICHPHRGTIQALTEQLPIMKKQGIRFVYASALVR